jgi:hypothetical protein
MKKHPSLSVLAALAALASPEAWAFGRGMGQQLATLRAEKSVPARQIEALRNDFEWVKTLRQGNTNPEMLRIMGLESAAPDQLAGWLSERVHYLISESFEPSAWNVLPFLTMTPEFPNPGVIPEIEMPPNPEKPKEGETRGMTVMANLGSALYLAGKMGNVVMGLRLSGIGRIPVKSPRIGAIQIGEGLFHKDVFGEEIPSHSPVRSAFRMATFFHEARHSDGNGKSLGFLHGLCPADHDLAGLGGCDRNLNGPYTVGALMQEHMVVHCSNCSMAEREALRVMALESRSRLISQKDGSPAVEWDATPEGKFEGF